MTQALKTYGWAALGLAIMIGAMAFGFYTAATSTMPNDPNIGAGILFMFGGMHFVAGLGFAWLMRRQRSGVEPTPSDAVRPQQWRS